MLNLKRLGPIVLIATVFASTAAAAADGRWEKTADGVVVTPASGHAKRVRLQVMSDRIIHVTATPTESLETPASLMVTAKPGGTFEAHAQGDKVVLLAGNATAEVSLTTGLVQFFDAHHKPVLAEARRAAFEPVKADGQNFWTASEEFNPGTDEAFYGLGQHQNRQMNYNGEDVEIAQHNMDVGIPFVLSSRNYGVLWDNNSITRFGDPRPYGLASRDVVMTGADGKPGGLTARYYVDGKLQLTRTEKDINYQYLDNLDSWPAEVKGKANQSVVWEGRVQSDKPGVHRFRLYVSSYVKVYVDGKLVIDAWRQNWNPWYRNFDVAMQPGQSHTIKIEWTPDDGYIALVHNNPMPEADRHSLALTSEVAKAIDYYFVDGENLDQVISGYRQLTGKAVLMPRWAYGYWQSREHYNTQAELLDVLHEYRKRGLPLDNMVQDWFYWREDDWGSHKFDPKRYPDPQAMVDEVHAQHAHIMISVWPKFYPTTEHYKELDALGGVYHGNVEAGVKDWVGPGYVSTYYDPYSAKVSDVYWRQVQENLGVMKFDAWWLDNDEPDIHSNTNIDERKRIMGPTAIGPAAEYFNTFPLVHVGGVYDHWRAAHPDDRVFLFTRSGYGGLQRYSAAVWSGDVASRWSDLGDQVSAGVNFSMSGIPNWTFDIGGFALEHRYEKPDAANLEEWRELNLRWFQFGAFAPLFRSHGGFPYREIYNISPEGTEVYDSMVWYDRLRYRLMPYIYTEAADTYHRDSTMMRGLVMDFADDARVRGINDEYMFGPAFLVAPVHEYKARSRKVYLPSGVRWYDFYTGEAFDGGREIDAAAPLSRMPLFVKAGTILPIGPAVQYTGEKPDAPITLYIYRGHDGAFELYEDDGVSYGYERGAYSRIPITWDEAKGVLTIGRRGGSFPGMPAERTFNVRWIAPGAAKASDLDAAPDKQVRYSGEQVTVQLERR
jgi:alpha-D-xyloside xylohydrolase